MLFVVGFRLGRWRDVDCSILGGRARVISPKHRWEVGVESRVEVTSRGSGRGRGRERLRGRGSRHGRCSDVDR